MAAHAILSPSGASRWMTCTPSARFEEQFPDKSSEYAKEGTLAHTLGELLILDKLGRIEKEVFKKSLKTIEANDLYNESMLEYCDDYATFVCEQYATAQAHTKDAMLFLEQKLDMTEWVPDGFGTGDVVIIADGTLDFTDLKYGKGVAVYAENNKQLMLYALGALHAFDFMYNIEIIRMTIYQPRINNTSTWEISAVDLKVWAETELKPKAAMAWEGIGEYVPGVHCQFCKAKAVCKALANENLQMAKYDFRDINMLTEEEVADILNRADMFTDWIKAVEDHALAEALAGKEWPGYKLVEGRSNRKYSDEDAVAAKLLKQGYAEDEIYNKKLVSITALEKELGKKEFASMLGDLIIKPAGKPCLADVNDKRPVYNKISSAVNDFA